MSGIEKRTTDTRPDAETIAYCPECEAELSDFFFGTDGSPGGTPIGRCRDCNTPVWFSPDAAALLASDHVTLGMMRSLQTATDHSENSTAPADNVNGDRNE